jgi:hypothetical protein
MFHANYVDLDLDEAAIPADFAQFICARKIVLHTPLLDESHRDLFRFITGTRNSLEKVRIRSNGSNQGEFCELLVNVSFDYY